MPKLTTTLTGVQSGTVLLPDTGRGIYVRRIDMQASLRTALRVFRGSTDDEDSRLFDFEEEEGIQLYLSDDENPKGVLFEGDLRFSGGVAGEDVHVTIDYSDARPDRSDRSLKLSVLLPWYNYPNWYDGEPLYVWPQVVAQHSPLSPVTAIINANDGPDGAGPNADYLVGLALFRDNGIRMIGYVSTNYGDRSLALVKADIDLWADEWGDFISGIFFDETPDAFDKGDIEYYREVSEYARAAFEARGVQSPLLVGNPGTDQTPEYYPFFDVVCSFESIAADWAANKGIANPGSMTHCALVYSDSSTAGQRAVRVKEAFDEGYRYIYVTDDGPDANPWDELDTLWAEQMRFVRRMNGGGAVL